MDLATLALSVYNFVKPVFTSKAAGQIAGDFKEATKGSMLKLWEKIKPWFIIEEKEIEELKDLKQKPEDKDFEEAFVSKLKAKLKKDEELQAELKAILTEMESGDDEKATIIIKNSKNVATGNFSNITGNITFGDKNKIKDK